MEHILVIFSYLCISQWLIDVKVKQGGGHRALKKLSIFPGPGKSWKTVQGLKSP